MRDFFKAPYIETTLIYRASELGWDSTQFHQYCDNEGSTLVIIRANNRTFGGFTTRSWAGSNIYKRDMDAFIFSLDDNIKILPKDGKN
jgi:hypothetical protein